MGMVLQIYKTKIIIERVRDIIRTNSMLVLFRRLPLCLNCGTYISFDVPVLHNVNRTKLGCSLTNI